ncbi:MAG: diguanylate cyclase [Rhodocyclales bacterium]|nr:diguanylate cyclase [Rhodocyclales bacterium]
MAGNVLIVDDTPPVLKLLKDILSAEGYKARPFNNGELALRSIAAEPPELILLDVRMPGMDGFEVCRRIKEDEKLNDIPVIFISAATDTDDKIKAFEAGGVDYITKPFQKEEVLARVQTHVALHRSRQKLLETQNALRKSEQSLKIAQAVAQLGHWEMDVQSGELSWSDETYRIFGFAPQAVAPSYEAFLKLLHPDDRERVASHIETAKQGNDFDIEYRIVLPGERVRVIHGKGALVSFPGQGRKTEIIGTVQCDNEVIGVIQDITTRKEMEWRLEHEARTDALTGCSARRYFLEIAQQEFARSRRYGSSLSLLMLDLDHFKKINDTHGHHVGDLTLQKLAQVCRVVLRQEDMVGRLGGEEFAILLIETGSERAFEVAERLREALATTDVALDTGATLRFTASIGVATVAADDAGIDAPLIRADEALYRAKNAGRNRIA